MPLPQWINPQLTKLATKAPSGSQWVHEIKFDGYRMAARIDRGKVKLLTRTGLDWTRKHPGTAAAFAGLKATTAYVDGELCGVGPDGVTSFELMQTASDRGGGGLVFFAFDLLELDGEDVARLALREGKARLKALLKDPPDGIAFSDHEGGDGEIFRQAACTHLLEGIVSKRIDRPYLPGDRGAWVKTKCLNRAEFVVVGWWEPEGSRPYVGALLLGYFEPDGRLVYAGRVGTSMSQKTLATLHKRLQPAGDQKDAARGSSASRQPLRQAVGVGQSALGPARAGRRDHLLELAGRGTSPPYRLRRPAGGQARERGPAREAGVLMARTGGRGHGHERRGRRERPADSRQSRF
jgi:DNA ligase D-like protein (predicted ligase)